MPRASCRNISGCRRKLPPTIKAIRPIRQQTIRRSTRRSRSTRPRSRGWRSQLTAEGLGQVVNYFNPDGSFGGQVFVETQKIELTVNIAAFTAQAGQIKFFATDVNGTGILDAPSDVTVNITDTSRASLNIEGITIPQLTGGAYFNGAVVTSNADFNGKNDVNVGRNNEPQPASDENALEDDSQANFSQIVSSATQATPVINITSTYQGLPNANPSQPAADVFITGAVNALEATLSIASAGDINITASTNVAHQNFHASHSIVIDQSHRHGRRKSHRGPDQSVDQCSPGALP